MIADRTALTSAARITRLLLTLGYGLLLSLAIWPTMLLLTAAETLEGRAFGLMTALTLGLLAALLVGAPAGGGVVAGWARSSVKATNDLPGLDRPNRFPVVRREFFTS